MATRRALTAPPFVGDQSAYFLAVNRNKKSVVLDLGTHSGVRNAQRLIEGADIVVENFKPGYMDQFGIGYEQLSTGREDLIYCAITAFGQEGPYSEVPGYDLLVASIGGLIGITGEPTGPPIKPGLPLVDLMSGMYAYGSILAALFHRQKTGEGQRIDVPLIGVQLASLMFTATAFLNAGWIMKPAGTGHPALVPYQVFQATDGYLALAAGNDGLFNRLADCVGRPEWKTDPRWKTNPDRVRNRDALLPLVEAAIGLRTVSEWLQIMREGGVPAAPVNSIDAVFDDPQVQFMNQIVDVPHVSLGVVRTIGHAVKFSRSPASVRSAPPILGQDTDATLG